MTKLMKFISFLFVLVILTACGNVQQEVKKERLTADEMNIEIVQKAVNSYREKTKGLLPIQTRNADVNRYIKYPIDFNRLKKEHILDTLPTNSFEKGGVFQYVIWHANSNKPVVKLIDLQQAEVVQELTLKKKVNGFIPISEKIHGNIYQINYKKMGYKKNPSIKSPYSDVYLPIVVKGTGEILIDYSIELQKIVDEMKPKVKKGKDIRYLLEEKYPILPAYSAAYVLNSNGEVEFYDDLTK